MQWKPFQHGTEVYDLAHLHPCTLHFEQAAQDKKPAITFTVDVTFSTHCFTRGLPEDDVYDRAFIYRDARETRLFDIRRYELSKQLPAILAGLQKQKCMHTGHGNFFTVALVDENGQSADYDIFFTASKSSTRGRVNLFIQSAFVREKDKLPPSRPIRFDIILYNTLNGRPIRD